MKKKQRELGKEIVHANKKDEFKFKMYILWRARYFYRILRQVSDCMESLGWKVEFKFKVKLGDFYKKARRANMFKSKFKEIVYELVQKG